MPNIHIKTAKSYIRRSPFQALAAIFVLSVTFFMATLIGVLIYTSEQALRHFETRPQIIAFIKNDAEDDVISELRSKLVSDTRIKSVRYVDQEEALEIYRRATRDNPLLTELVSPSIFPASIEFSVTDLNFTKDVIEEVRQNDIVEEVGFTANLGDQESINNVIERLKNATYVTRIGGLAFVGFLLGTSFLVLTVIVSLRLANRKNEMDILSLLGATPGFIRNPIILESLIYVVSGLIVGWLSAVLLVLYLTPSVSRYFSDIELLPKDMAGLMALFGIIFGILFVVGTTLSLLGSTLVLSRKRRKP